MIHGQVIKLKRDVYPNSNTYLKTLWTTRICMWEPSTTSSICCLTAIWSPNKVARVSPIEKFLLCKLFATPHRSPWTLAAYPPKHTQKKQNKQKKSMRPTCGTGWCSFYMYIKMVEIFFWFPERRGGGLHFVPWWDTSCESKEKLVNTSGQHSSENLNEPVMCVLPEHTRQRVFVLCMFDDPF